MGSCPQKEIFSSGDASTWKLPINASDNATKASAGHGRNQSIVGHENTPGNFETLTFELLERSDVVLLLLIRDEGQLTFLGHPKHSQNDLHLVIHVADGQLDSGVVISQVIINVLESWANWVA